MSFFMNSIKVVVRIHGLLIYHGLILVTFCDSYFL